MALRHPIDRIQAGSVNFSILHSNGAASRIISYQDIIERRVVLNTDPVQTAFLTSEDNLTIVDVTPEQHDDIMAGVRRIQRSA